MMEALSLFGQAAGGTGLRPYGGAQKADPSKQDLAPNQAAVEEIKEIGFGRWYEELREKKIEEIRQEILASMGLTEEDLSAMSPDARAAIEQSISQKINETLAAQSVDSDTVARQGTDMPNALSPAAGGFTPGGAAGIGATLGPASMTVLLDAQENAYRAAPREQS